METQIEKQEPYFTLPLTGEQYTLLRNWLDAEDHIEVVTDGKDKVMLINSRKLSEKNNPNLTKDCQHCPNNPKATKPFIKMKKIPIENSYLKEIEETAKIQNKSPECFACELVQTTIDKLSSKD